MYSPLKSFTKSPVMAERMLKVTYVNKNEPPPDDIARMKFSVNVIYGCKKLGIKNTDQLRSIMQSASPFYQKIFGNDSRAEIRRLLSPCQKFA